MDFQKVYPFTTEDISGYLMQLEVENKKILTVGSSADQALNSILLGAKEVTIFDINEEKENFYKTKKDIILNSSRKEFYDRVLNLKKFSYFDDIFSQKALEKMNLYMTSDESFEKLKQIIDASIVKFATGNIFEIKNSNIIDNDFDLLLLSNVMQYFNTLENQHVEEEVFKIYKSLCDYLNANGIIQFYYLYGSLYPNNFSKILNYFLNNDIILEKLKCTNSNDSIILAKKKKF